MEAGRIVLVDGEKPRLLGIRGRRQNVLELHPLPGEGIEEPFDLGIGEHSLHGLGKVFRLREFTAFSQAEKLGIRSAGPQEKGQFGGQRILGILIVFSGITEKEERRRQRSRSGFLHTIGERLTLLDLLHDVGHVAFHDIIIHEASKGLHQKRLQPLSHLSLQVGFGLRLLEEIVPYPHGALVEVRTFHDRYRQAQKRVQQEGGEGQLVGLVVKPVRSPQILGKRFHSFHFDTGRERGAGNLHPVRHLAGVGMEIIVTVPGHQLLGQGEYVAVQLEKVANRIVVLEAVQTTDPASLHYLAGTCSAQHVLQGDQEFLAILGFQFRLVFRRHVAGIDGLDHFLDQGGFGQKVLGRSDLLEVDLALHLFFAMALRAMGGPKGLQVLVEVLGCLAISTDGGKPQQQADCPDGRFNGHGLRSRDRKLRPCCRRSFSSPIP